MDAMDAVALGARVQQVADKLLHKAQEARARGNAAAAQSLTESVSDLRHAAAVLVEQKRLLTVRGQSSDASQAQQQQPPSSSSSLQENGADAMPKARLRRNSSASSVMSMLSTYEIGSVAGSVAGSAQHSHSHLQMQQHQELVARLTRVEKMLGKKSDEMKAKGNESAANALLQSAKYVRSGGSFIAEQQHTINVLTSSREKLQTQWRALSKILAREEQEAYDNENDDADGDADANVLSKVTAIAAELVALRSFLKAAFPECRDHGDVSELAAALQREREAAKTVKAEDENAQQQLSADAVEALEEERDHLKQQLVEAKRVYEEEYLVAREDIEILKSENAMLKRQLQAAEMQNQSRNERELLEQQTAYEAMVQAKEELKDVVDAHKEQLSDLAIQVESWKTQFYDEQAKLSETLAANSKYAAHITSLGQELKAKEETIAALEKSVATKTNEAANVPLLESDMLSDDEAAAADTDAKSEMTPLKQLHDARMEELQMLLDACKKKLESEQEKSAQFAVERDALVARMSEIERGHESELEVLKIELDIRVAEVERERQIAQQEVTKLQGTLKQLEIESETHKQISSELKQAVDEYREGCFAARKVVEERDSVISQLQTTLQRKEESVDDAHSQIEAKLLTLRSDLQTLCACFESAVDAAPEVVVRSLSDLTLESEPKMLRDALVLQLKSHAALKQEFDRVQADEQVLREMSKKFLSSCDASFAQDANSAVMDIGERFDCVQVNFAKALDEIGFLKKAVDENAVTKQTLKQKLGELSELEQKLSSTTDAVYRLEQQLETAEAEKAVIVSQLQELRSKSVDGAGREEARAQEMEILEQRLKELEAEYERYRGRSHTALKKVEKRAELLNGMRKENELLKKQFEDAEAECQRVLDSEKRLVESLQEAIQSQRMMQEEFQQREIESVEQAVVYQAQLVRLTEVQQVVQRELLEATEMVKKLKREKSELADTRNQFYEQERAAKDAELMNVKLQYQTKEDEVVALTDEIQVVKAQLETQAAKLTESVSNAESLQAKFRESEMAIAKLEGELSAVRTTEQTSNDAAGETVKKLQGELNRLQAALAEEKVTSEKRCAELASQVNQLRLEAKAAQDTISRLSREIDERSVIAEPAAAAVQERTESHVASAQEAEVVTRLQEEKRTLESKHHDQEARIAQMVSQVRGYEHRIEFLEEQIGTLQNQLEEADSSEHEYNLLTTTSSVDAAKDDTIRELRRQVIDLQEQLEHFEGEHAARELEQERGELEEIQAARMELQKKNAHALNLKQRKALVTTFKKHLHTVVDELQRGLDEHSAAFRDACEFRDAHNRRKAAVDNSEVAAAAVTVEDGPLPAEGASTEGVLPAESSRSSDRSSSGDEFEEYLVMNSGVVIKAGASFKLPVFCEKKGWRVVWTFTVKEDGADVGFALAAESAASKNTGGDDDGDRKLIVAPERVNTLLGVYNIEDDGLTLVFEWDNTFSWLNEKTLDYHVSVQEPLSLEKQQIKVQERSLLNNSKQIRDGLAILAAEADSRAQLKSAVDHLRTSEQEKDAYLEQFNARKDDILQQKIALQQQMEELKTALSGMLSEQDEIEDDTRTLLKAWSGADAEREDAETTIRLAETSQFENLVAQLETQVQTLEQALLSFQDSR